MDFWSSLVEAIRSSTPRAWRQPAGLPPPPDCFEAVCAAAAGPNAGPVARCRLYVDGAAAPLDLALLPALSDGSFRAWLDRTEPSRGALGLVVNDIQAATPAFGRYGRAWCAPISRALGIPAAGTSLDVFAGRYGRGAFGLHKDEQDVVTMVLEGRKRFHLWPFAAFVDVHPGLAIRNHQLGDADLAPPSALLVLEGGPGDVLFWPAEWWHVAVAVDDAPVVTIGLGLRRASEPLRLLAEAVEVASAAGALPPLCLPSLPTGGDAAVDPVYDALLAWLAAPPVRDAAREVLLGWASAWGLMALPPPLEAPPLGETVQLAENATLCWSRTPEAILLAAAGRVYTLPYHPALVPLFTRLLEGSPLDVHHAVATYAGVHIEDGEPYEADADAIVAILTLLRDADVLEG